MATDRERFKVRNTLICLLKAVEGLTTTVELRNESRVSGIVEHVDGYMNITMSNVCYRNYKGKINRFENFFIQGQQIRFVQIPDEIDMRSAIEYHATKDRLMEKRIHQEIFDAAQYKMKRKEQNYKRMLREEEKKEKNQTKTKEKVDEESLKTQTVVE